MGDRSLQIIFGEVVRSCRKERKISQEKLAIESQLQRTFISRMECGKTQPTLVTIFELAKALGMDPTEIIARVQKAWLRK